MLTDSSFMIQNGGMAENLLFKIKLILLFHGLLVEWSNLVIKTTVCLSTWPFHSSLLGLVVGKPNWLILGPFTTAQVSSSPLYVVLNTCIRYRLREIQSQMMRIPLIDYSEGNNDETGFTCPILGQGASWSWSLF